MRRKLSRKEKTKERKRIDRMGLYVVSLSLSLCLRCVVVVVAFA